MDNTSNSYRGTCSSCEYFEESNKFCRANPPTPVVMTVKHHTYDKDVNTIRAVFPIIEMPTRDWCGFYCEEGTSE